MREIDVLKMLERRMTNMEIAAALVMSPSTVKFHLKSIFSKFGVTTRQGAVAHFRQIGVGRSPSSPGGNYGFSPRACRPSRFDNAVLKSRPNLFLECRDDLLPLIQD